MTTSESVCRNWVKKNYLGAEILKIPDFKQTNNHHAAGWPDFLVVHNNKIFFLETKKWNAKTFTPAQKVMFKRLQKQGAEILIWQKEKRGYTLFVYPDN